MDVLGAGFCECVDEGFHAIDFDAVDLFHDQVAQAFVADGGGGWDGAAEENDALGLVLVFLRILVGIEEVERCSR